MTDIVNIPQTKREWLLFLDNISNENGGDVAREFWAKLCQIFPNAPIPAFWPSEDGKIVQFGWDKGERHLDIDIALADATPEWFFLDKGLYGSHNQTDSGYGIDTVEFRKFFELMIPQ